MCALPIFRWRGWVCAAGRSFSFGWGPFAVLAQQQRVGAPLPQFAAQRRQCPGHLFLNGFHGNTVGFGDAALGHAFNPAEQVDRSEEHTSELQSLMRISYAVFCLKKKKSITK